MSEGRRPEERAELEQDARLERELAERVEARSSPAPAAAED